MGIVVVFLFVLVLVGVARFGANPMGFIGGLFRGVFNLTKGLIFIVIILAIAGAMIQAGMCG
jgi:hypothetical protein